MGFYHQGALIVLGIISMTTAQRVLFMGSNVIRPNANYAATVSSLSGETISVTVSIVNNVTGQVVAEENRDIRGRSQDSYSIPIPGTVSETDQYVVRVRDGSLGNARYKNETVVSVEKKSRSIFIVTDKAIYKPGALVRFRAFVLDVTLRPRLNPLDVEIYDPKGNKIKQWLNEAGESGVVSGDLQLSTITPLGDWQIKVTSEMESASVTFKVDEYVLPKFEVTVSTDPPFLVASKTTKMYMRINVKAMYNIGTPVDGEINIHVRPQRTWYNIRAVSFRKQIAGTATAEVSYDPGTFTCVVCTMVADVWVVDSLSGENRTASVQFNTYEQPEKLQFMDGPKYLKPGLTSRFVLKLTQRDGSPIPNSNKQVTVKTTESNRDPFSEPPVREYTFPLPESGMLEIEHQTALSTTSLTVEAEYNGATAAEYVTEVFKSFSNQSLSVERSGPQGGSNGEIIFVIQSTEPISRIYYQILSKKNVEGSGHFEVNPPSTTTTIPVSTSPSMAPSSTFIAYYLTAEGELIAASDRFDVEFRIPNQMGMAWDSERKQVNEQATLTVQAAADSFIAVGAVDKSVLQLAESNDITLDRVMAELELYDHATPTHRPCCGPIPVGRGKRSFIWPAFNTASDTAKVIESAGLVFMTDAKVYRKQQYDGPVGRVLFNYPRRASPEALTPTRVRSNFPETWLWQTSVAGPNGIAQFSVTVPDTLTTWVASAFALHPQYGLGIPPRRANITAFMPFFLRVNTPYSVIRGEEITLNVNVFNYLGSTIEATVDLQSSTEFMVKENENDTAASKTIRRSVQVMDTKGAIVSFIIIPEKLGTITLRFRGTASGGRAADAIDQPLLVEPEGRLVEMNKAFYVDLSSGQDFQGSETITFPAENVVAGSEMITVSIIGDLLGTTLAGLKNLVRMPYGCGEQNMITFTPNIYVRRYLEATGGLTAALQSDTTKFMDSGYQRELSYQRKDGSFSAFGERDESGSTWLTAFVIQSFKQASAYIYVDEGVLVKALKWLIQNTYNSGTSEFREVGTVFHKEMQGGSLNTMTAYVLIALQQCRDLETNVTGLLGAITGARQTLEKAVDSTDDVYGLAIMAYALQLTGSPASTRVLNKLNSLAKTRDGDQKYWEVKSKDSSRHRRSNNEVELASFVLLTHVLRTETAEALPIAKFLMASKNPLGGFSSTQDTVWGLNALSEFGALTRSLNQLFNVFVSYGSNSFPDYEVNAQNSQVLYQQNVDPSLIQKSERINVRVSGTGTGLVEVSSRYHTTTEEENPILKITVNSKPRNPNVREIIGCVRSTDSTFEDMVVMEINDESGFPVDVNSIPSYEYVSRTEKADKTTAIYFSNFPAEQERCVMMVAYKSSDVRNARAPMARVFGYYTGEETVISYGQLNDTDPNQTQGLSEESTTVVGTTKGGNDGPSGASSRVSASSVIAVLLCVCAFRVARG